jgi:DNA excision repair protein ERCC-1
MDDDDEFGADSDFLAALIASESSVTPRIEQPKPQRIQQPTPQRLDRAPPTPSTTSSAPKVVQPTPQTITSRSSGSSILVSPRQKGNPILTNLRSFAWEYSDIPADYVLGLTTCTLFLSLKYHRLHPEYIYNRIKGLAGKYNLRIVLVMVDIGNHEDSVKELSRTSLINNVTIMLCWSAAEAARYLELYKSYEHANPSAIRGTESKGYTDKMVDFMTVPRSINKTDAVSLVTAFGSIRAAVNARADEIGVIGGWGETKIRRWCAVVDEPFRARKAAKRGLPDREPTQDGEVDGPLDRAIPLSRVPLRDMASAAEKAKGNETSGDPPQEPERSDAVDQFQIWDPADEDEEALLIAAAEEEEKKAEEKRKQAATKDDELSGGIAAALAKLREND